MRAIRLLGMANIVTLLFLGIASGTAAAQSTKVQGIIKSRSGPDIILNTSQDPNMVVMLTDSTDVGQVEGLLKARSKQMSMAALIPGPRRFCRRRQQQPERPRCQQSTIQGQRPEERQSHRSRHARYQSAGAKEPGRAAKQNAELQAQNEALQKHEAAIAANKAAVDAAIARFGQLDDYYIMDEVTIYFANGKTKVDPKYISQITTLAQNASKVEGYMIEIKGYASAVGSPQVNQKISQERAQNVANILLQQGKVSLTRMLAPGAMGESEQVSTDKTVEGQAENRRVVVRVLQNKAIAGIPAA